jgi:hypothetical protein
MDLADQDGSQTCKGPVVLPEQDKRWPSSLSGFLHLIWRFPDVLSPPTIVSSLGEFTSFESVDKATPDAAPPCMRGRRGATPHLLKSRPSLRGPLIPSGNLTNLTSPLSPKRITCYFQHFGQTIVVKNLVKSQFLVDQDLTRG